MKLPNDYQNFIALSRYARWLPEKKIRERNEYNCVKGRIGEGGSECWERKQKKRAEKNIIINKNYVDLISGKKIFRVKKVNLCIGNIGLIKVLKQSNLIFNSDIITYEDSAIKYVLNFNLNHKNFYYIPMSIKQIIFLKLIYFLRKILL